MQDSQLFKGAETTQAAPELADRSVVFSRPKVNRATGGPNGYRMGKNIT